MRFSLSVASFALMLVVFPAIGKAWQKEYAYEYQMSENDSRNSAREAAVEQIKVLASQEAGTYIQGTTVLQGDDLTETITQIGASIVKVEVKSDAVSVGQDGRQTLTVVALADVDESVMAKRIEALREDKEKVAQVKRLADENRKLQEQLAVLRVEFLESSSYSQEARAKSSRLEAALLKRLKENLESTDKVFDLGSLANLARRAAAERDSTEANAIEKWDSILNELVTGDVKLDIIDMQVSKDESGYIAAYEVRLEHMPDQQFYEAIGHAPGSRINGAFPPAWCKGRCLDYVSRQRVIALVKIGERVISRHTILAWSGWDHRLGYNPKKPENDECPAVWTDRGVRCGAHFTQKDIDAGSELTISVLREESR